MSDAVVVALIAGFFGLLSTVVTIIVAVIQSRAATRNSSKSDILQMILEDHIAVQEGHLPTNYQNILMAYQKYHDHGGDEFITDKKEEYKRWFETVEKRRKRSGKRK